MEKRRIEGVATSYPCPLKARYDGRLDATCGGAVLCARARLRISPGGEGVATLALFHGRLPGQSDRPFQAAPLRRRSLSAWARARSMSSRLPATSRSRLGRRVDSAAGFGLRAAYQMTNPRLVGAEADFLIPLPSARIVPVTGWSDRRQPDDRSRLARPTGITHQGVRRRERRLPFATPTVAGPKGRRR